MRTLPLLVALCSCSPTLRSAPASTCAALDTEQRHWGWVAQAGTVAAGSAGGLTMAAPSDRAAWWLGVSSAAIAAAAAGSAWAQTDAADRWAGTCAGPPTDPR